MRFMYYKNLMPIRRRTASGTKGGRPALPAKQRKVVVRAFRMTLAEDQLVRRAARSAGVPVTRWIRQQVIETAQNEVHGHGRRADHGKEKKAR